MMSGIPGANAGQQGSWHVIDALLGLEHNEDFLREQRRFMPAKQSAFVDEFTSSPAKHSLLAYFDARPALDREADARDRFLERALHRVQPCYLIDPQPHAQRSCSPLSLTQRSSFHLLPLTNVKALCQG